MQKNIFFNFRNFQTCIFGVLWLEVVVAVAAAASDVAAVYAEQKAFAESGRKLYSIPILNPDPHSGNLVGGNQ